MQDYAAILDEVLESDNQLLRFEWIKFNLNAKLSEEISLSLFLEKYNLTILESIVILDGMETTNPEFNTFLQKTKKNALDFFHKMNDKQSRNCGDVLNKCEKLCLKVNC